MNARIGCHVFARETCEVSGEVFFAYVELLIASEQQRFQPRSPNHSARGDSVKQITRTGKIPGQDKTTVALIPKRECPVSYQSPESRSTPAFDGSHNNGSIREIVAQAVHKPGHQLVAIVEAAVPSEHISGP